MEACWTGRATRDVFGQLVEVTACVRLKDPSDSAGSSGGIQGGEPGQYGVVEAGFVVQFCDHGGHVVQTAAYGDVVGHVESSHFGR